MKSLTSINKGIVRKDMAFFCFNMIGPDLDYLMHYPMIPAMPWAAIKRSLVINK